MRLLPLWLICAVVVSTTAGAIALGGGPWALLLRAMLTAAATAAILAGVRRHRHGRTLQSHWTHPDPWVLIALAFACRVAMDLATVLGTFSPWFGRIAAVEAAFFAGGSVILIACALVEMARCRFGERYVDHCLEAVILAGSVTLVLWSLVVQPFLAVTGQTMDSGLPHAAALAITLGLAVVACLLLGSFEGSQPALAAMAVAQTLFVLAVVLRFFAEATGTPVVGGLAVGATCLAIALMSWAAGHPSMSFYEEPAKPIGARLSRARVINLLFPVAFGSVVLLADGAGVIPASTGVTTVMTLTVCVLVIVHLMAMVQARASSTHWASHDKLTGLPNRALFRERCAQALERGRKHGHQAAVLYLDLDRFKHINDSMGHEAGDQLLELVAKRIVACVDEGDTVARLGGDEFAILLSRVESADEASDLARRLLTSFAVPFALKPRPVLMSPSVGISVSDRAASLETLLTQADTAMYRAKESGRNNFAVWSIEMNKAANERLTLEMSLHSALANEELRLVYQPKVELATGRIVGVEALLRWNHPTLGMVSPATFINIAEESGLITQIGEWVLDTACAQAKAWQVAGFEDVTMAVNLSSRQFQQQRVANLISRTLRRTGLDAHLLEVELTESVAMAGGDSTVDQLQELRALGVTCAIDDFGTGYSNLSYLSRFPVDTLKIDRAFVQQIDKSSSDAAIVVAIIAMAHGLGLEVVAEGVETPEQAAFLKANSCDLMQGFLFSRPLPPGEVEAMLLVTHAPVAPAVRGTGWNSRSERRSSWPPAKAVQSSD